MKVRVAVPEAFAAEGARVRRALKAAGMEAVIVSPDAETDLVLRTAEGAVDLPGSPAAAAIIGLAEPRDALVAGPEESAGLSELPAGARVALAGSLRAEMLAVHRPDLHGVPVDDPREAAELLDRGDVAAWIAPVGVVRAVGLGDAVREIFEPTSWATAAGRGSSLLRSESGDDALAELLAELDERAARAALEAERTVLDVLGVGPDAPVGVMARPHGPLLRMRALIPARAGQRLVRADFSGRLDDPATAGRRIGEQLVARGGLDLLAAGTS